MSDLITVLSQGNNFSRLVIDGFGTTLYIALMSSLLSVVFGIIMGFLRTLKNRPLKFILKLYLEFFRLMPQLVLLFVFYFGITNDLGLNLSAIDSSIIVFTLWGAAEMGELVRSAIQTVAAGEIEAGESLGLSKLQIWGNVVFGVTIRKVIPPTVNLLTRIIKTTAIVPLIGVMDVTKVGQAIIDFNRFQFPAAAFWIYAVIFLLFFIACYALSVLSRVLEKKLG